MRHISRQCKRAEIQHQQMPLHTIHRRRFDRRRVSDFSSPTGNQYNRKSNQLLAVGIKDLKFIDDVSNAGNTELKNKTVSFKKMKVEIVKRKTVAAK